MCFVVQCINFCLLFKIYAIGHGKTLKHEFLGHKITLNAIVFQDIYQLSEWNVCPLSKLPQGVHLTEFFITIFLQKNLKHTKKHWKFSVIIRIFVFSCVPNVINLFVVTYLYFGPPLLLSFLLTAQTKHIWQKISNNKICRFVWLIDDIYKLIL